MLLEKGSIGQSRAVLNSFQKEDVQLQTVSKSFKKKKFLI